MNVLRGPLLAVAMALLTGVVAGCSSQPEKPAEPSALEQLLGTPTLTEPAHGLTPMRRVLKRAYVRGLRRTCVYALSTDEGEDDILELQRAFWQRCPVHPEQVG